MTGWWWSRQDWKDLQALHARHPGLRHAMLIGWFRYAAEGCKDLAMGLIVGVVAGLIVARFSSWSPTLGAWAVVFISIGFSLIAFMVGRLLAELATLGEEAATQGPDFDLVIRIAKKIARVPALMLGAGLVYALWQLFTIPPR